MKNNPIKLSIIIPVFNAESTISYSLESALLQRTDFEFEVIAVDDGSTDKTAEILEQYQKIFSNLLVIRNAQNLGKGDAFKKAYTKAMGEYFHVLDGDDYFVSYDKLQKQVTVLDANQHIFAVAHNSVVTLCDKSVGFINNQLSEIEYSYENCINFDFYHHTSSFMFRKLLKELPEEFSTHRALRGDSACFYLHAFTSKQGVKFLPDVSSVYNLHGNGLWSVLTGKEKQILIQELFESLQNIIIRNPYSIEHTFLESKKTKNETVSETSRHGNLIPEQILKTCFEVAKQVYEPKIYNQIFQGVHSLRLIDQLCETIGRIMMVQSGYRSLNRIFDTKKVAFLVSGLKLKGGEIFQSICNLIEIHLNEGKKILIVVSCMSETDMSAIEEFLKNPAIEFFFVEGETLSERVQLILDTIYKAAPGRLYPFISHHDVINCTAVQKGLAGEIVLDYVYDHGSSLGLLNSSIDKIICKSTRQFNTNAQILSQSKLCLIPYLFQAKFNTNPYNPLKNVTLTTACAATYSHKVEMTHEFEYCDVITEIISITEGQHFHFGPLTESYLARIIKNLKARFIDTNKFVHIPYPECLSIALNNAGIDLFFTTFPVFSALIGIEVMSCGIPMVCYKPDKSNFFMGHACDFLDHNQWSWSTPNEISTIIKSATVDGLLKKSLSAHKHFKTYNDFSKNYLKIIKLYGEDVHINDVSSYKVTDIIDNNLYNIEDINKMISKGVL